MKDKIETLTGIKPAEMDSIFSEVKANGLKLEGCSGPHDFSICLDRYTKQPIENPTPQQRFGAKFQCSKCGGWVDSLARIWYNRGFNHGKYFAFMTAQSIASDVINRESAKYAQPNQQTPTEMTLSGLCFFVTDAIVSEADKIAEQIFKENKK